MKASYLFLFLFIFIFVISLVSAVSINNPSLPLVQTAPTITSSVDVNYSLVNVNNSQFLQGLTPAQVAVLQTDRYNVSYVSTYNSTYNGYDSTYNTTYESKAGTGNCPAGQVVQNTTSGGVQCVTVSASGDGSFNSTYALWAYNQSTSPAGSNKQVQFNDNGVFGGATNISYNKTTGNVGIGTIDALNRLVVNADNAGATTQSLTASMAVRNSNPTTNNFATIAFQGCDTAGTCGGLVRVGAQYTSHAVGAQTANFHVDASNGSVTNEVIRCIGTTRQCFFTESSTSNGDMNYIATTTTQLGGTIKIINDQVGGGILIVNANAAPSPFISGRGLRGTMASPSQTQSGDEMLRTFGGGYTDTGWGNGVGGFIVKAGEALTSTSQASTLGLYTTPSGSVTAREAWRVEANAALNLINKTTGYIGYYPNSEPTLNRAMIHIGSANALADVDALFIGNRVAKGNVSLGANTATAGGAGEIETLRSNYQQLLIPNNNPLNFNDVGKLYSNGTNMYYNTTNQAIGQHIFNRQVTVEGNLDVHGNVTYKNPHAMFSDTSTQTVGATATAYPMQFNTTEENYQIWMTDKENLTVGQGGTYLIEISIMGVSSVANTHLEIWFQKNGVNVARSNTRYEFKGVNSEAVVAVPFIVDLTTSDRIRVMYAGDNTGITLPTTPATAYSPITPSTIMTITRVGDIT